MPAIFLLKSEKESLELQIHSFLPVSEGSIHSRMVHFSPLIDHPTYCAHHQNEKCKHDDIRPFFISRNRWEMASKVFTFRIKDWESTLSPPMNWLQSNMFYIQTQKANQFKLSQY